MFRTSIGPVDPLDELAKTLENKTLPAGEIRKLIDEANKRTAVYLRPETAQAMFVQFLNVQQSMSMKIPFGIAQVGKSFRNEIVTEHFIFRSCEFEQMEMEFFCEPGSQSEWMEHWRHARMNWYHRYANQKDKFRFRKHDDNELAHYSDECFDIEYMYPWGWGELEGIAQRTNFDLNQHATHSGQKLDYFDQSTNERYVPFVIEPAAGVNRAMAAFLLAAYKLTG
jgi:glycyl-tRNA synthetase